MITEDARTTTNAPPESPLHSTDRLLAPAAGVRLIARLRHSKLDRALSCGADPAASPLIAARATQLSRPRIRNQIAGGLERLARGPDQPGARARILPSDAAARANRPELLELARLLRGDRPLYARGIAMLEVALTDGAGPVYTDTHGEVLGRQLRLARAALTS